MENKPKLLAFAGSLRKESVNKKLVQVAAKGAEQAGAEVTFIDLVDYPLPILNQDDEQASGAPENAKKLHQLFAESDGFLLASPEYNGGMSAALKNLIDWLSRPSSGEPALAAFEGKIVSLMSASPGGLGGIRALPNVRFILDGLGCITLPKQLALSKAYEAFDEQGNLVNSEQQETALQLGRNVVDMAKKLIN
ncbi:NADPH-dependent FMN reductase [Spartinivicinus poritis]|uniref:NAD(P)H-dependent oxidoreductase n=1 Tax=Spartinivicinus poritis TaxID=2994640 RepID=A0ABT5UF04_9GAMM|nr:NAD(P)H-dependent oxidoreductase [Spartinivicinus sp. A2-2]MDE1464964.1 NAD(P)H-dependent oxidoreductase [Spartinivicinus sp. A2-2]